MLRYFWFYIRGDNVTCCSVSFHQYNMDLASSLQYRSSSSPALGCNMNVVLSLISLMFFCSFSRSYEKFCIFLISVWGKFQLLISFFLFLLNRAGKTTVSYSPSSVKSLLSSLSFYSTTYNAMEPSVIHTQLTTLPRNTLIRMCCSLLCHCAFTGLWVPFTWPLILPVSSLTPLFC